VQHLQQQDTTTDSRLGTVLAQLYHIKVSQYCPARLLSDSKPAQGFTRIHHNLLLYASKHLVLTPQHSMSRCSAGQDQLFQKLEGVGRIKASKVGESQLAWNSDVAASRVHLANSCRMHPRTSACTGTQYVMVPCRTGQNHLNFLGRKKNMCQYGKVGQSQLAWKSDVAASRVHLTKRCTSTTVVTDPEATASMMARDMPMLPSLKQLSIGFASACMRWVRV